MTWLTSKLAAYVGGAVALALLAWALVLRADLALTDHALAKMRTDLQAEQQGRADDRAAAAAAAASAATRAQADTAAIIATQQESIHVAQLARDRQDADRRAADAAHQHLLDAAAARGAGGQPAGDPTAVGSGFRAPAAVDLLPDVLGRLDQAAGDTADYADALRSSLRACRSEYGAVMRLAGARPAVSGAGSSP